MLDGVRRIDKVPDGVVKIPPSKSEGHRAVLCAALSRGHSVIRNIDPSQDICATIGCAESLGAKCELEGNCLKIEGIAGKITKSPLLDCGESGSTLRFIIPLATLFADNLILTGRGRLLRRPITEYFDVLGKNGVKCVLQDGAILVSGRLREGKYELHGHISSQFVSGLLLALPLLKEDSEIILKTPLQSKAYVDMTVGVMNTFGLLAENQDYERFLIRGGQSCRPQDYTLEGDFSSAANFLIAGALGCDIECMGLNENSLQGDRTILSILEQCGAQVRTGPNGGIKVEKGKLKPAVVDVSDIPDLVPPLAVLLSFCGGESRIVNAGRLRFKESDRLRAVTEVLNGLGADITEGTDFLVVRGVGHFRGGRADAHDDHRIAMAAALAAIKSTEPVYLAGEASVKKSYPGFWEDFCIKEKTYE